MVAIHSGAVDVARDLKPSIPTTGDYGIELHDEVELEMLLRDRGGAAPGAGNEAH
jgi:hypothetical protein